jgi:hypothetical protein
VINTPQTYQASPERTQLSLTLELDASDDTSLLRVLSTLSRRQCRVLRASFTGRLLLLEIEAHDARAGSVAAWLSALMPVLSVRQTESDG